MTHGPLVCLLFCFCIAAAAVLSNKEVVQTGRAIAKYPKFKDQFFLRFVWFLISPERKAQVSFSKYIVKFKNLLLQNQ